MKEKDPTSFNSSYISSSSGEIESKAFCSHLLKSKGSYSGFGSMGF